MPVSQRLPFYEFRIPPLLSLIEFRIKIRDLTHTPTVKKQLTAKHKSLNFAHVLVLSQIFLAKYHFQENLFSIEVALLVKACKKTSTFNLWRDGILLAADITLFVPFC